MEKYCQSYANMHISNCKDYLDQLRLPLMQVICDFHAIYTVQCTQDMTLGWMWGTFSWKDFSRFEITKENEIFCLFLKELSFDYNRAFEQIKMIWFEEANCVHISFEKSPWYMLIFATANLEYIYFIWNTKMYELPVCLRPGCIYLCIMAGTKLQCMH